MGLLLDVTLISTKHTAVSGVLVIEKLLVADEVLLMVWVKCCKLLSSLFAVTSIFTPPEGMADVMVTDKSKGPSDGVCTDPLAGLVVTATTSSATTAFFAAGRKKYRTQEEHGKKSEGSFHDSHY